MADDSGHSDAKESPTKRRRYVEGEDKEGEQYKTPDELVPYIDYPDLLYYYPEYKVVMTKTIHPQFGLFNVACDGTHPLTKEPPTAWINADGDIQVVFESDSIDTRISDRDEWLDIKIDDRRYGRHLGVCSTTTNAQLAQKHAPMWVMLMDRQQRHYLTGHTFPLDKIYQMYTAFKLSVENGGVYARDVRVCLHNGARHVLGTQHDGGVSYPNSPTEIEVKQDGVKRMVPIPKRDDTHQPFVPIVDVLAVSDLSAVVCVRDKNDMFFYCRFVIPVSFLDNPRSLRSNSTRFSLTTIVRERHV
jgi:hypothetical protein